MSVAEPGIVPHRPYAGDDRDQTEVHGLQRRNGRSLLLAEQDEEAPVAGDVGELSALQGPMDAYGALKAVLADRLPDGSPVAAVGAVDIQLGRDASLPQLRDEPHGLAETLHRIEPPPEDEPRIGLLGSDSGEVAGQERDGPGRACGRWSSVAP